MIVYASMSMCVFVPLYFHDLHIVYMNVHADTERERERKSQVFRSLSVRPKDWKGSLMLNTCQKQGPQVAAS